MKILQICYIIILLILTTLMPLVYTAIVSKTTNLKNSLKVAKLANEEYTCKLELERCVL